MNPERNTTNLYFQKMLQNMEVVMTRGLALAAFLCAIALPMQSLAQDATPEELKNEAAADDMEKKLPL